MKDNNFDIIDIYHSMEKNRNKWEVVGIRLGDHPTEVLFIGTREECEKYIEKMEREGKLRR